MQSFLNGWSHHFPKKRHSSALVKTFSDNIFAAFPLRSNPTYTDELVIRTFLHELKQQVCELTLYCGFPVRGAVTVGPLMFTEKFLFGPALVEAVELEKSAVFPRVLISSKLLRFLDPNTLPPNLLLKDSDGQVFLDYLSTPFASRVVLNHHAKYVLKGLQVHTARVRERQKYEWLARYHNYVATVAGHHELTVGASFSSAYGMWGRTPDVAVSYQHPASSTTGKNVEGELAGRDDAGEPLSPT